MAPKTAKAQPIKKRQIAKFSLSPLMRPAEELLQQKKLAPSSVDLRTLGVSSLSHASASAIVLQKDCPYTICGWPKGERTNERYTALLSLKDEYDIYFFLCKTSPDLCVFDSTKFKFSCLNHLLRRLIYCEIEDGKVRIDDFVGSSSPFSTAADVDYVTYLRWIEGPACSEKHNHELMLYRAENLLLQKLTAKGFDMPEGVSFSDSLRAEARSYDSEDRPQRNTSAHIFTSLLMQVKDEFFTSSKSDFPVPRRDVLTNMKELGKKVFVLEHLKSKLPKIEESACTQMTASLLLIEIFLSELVPRCQEVRYGGSRAMVPGKLPANTSFIQL